MGFLKYCLAGVFVIAFSCTGWAQAGADGVDTASLPKFYFKEGKVHDFGDVRDGDEPVYRFVYKNTGKSPLFIANITLSCECFSVDWPHYPVVPGGEGAITVKFPYTGRLGMFNKMMWVSSNAMMAAGQEELMIMGKVVEGPVTSKVATFDFLADTTHDFGKVAEGPELSYQFLYRNKGMVPIRITGVEPDCKCLAAAFQKEPVVPGRAGWIKVTYHTKGRPGAFDRSLRIRSNAVKKGGQLRIHVKGTVVSAQ
jgi:hypothetical protein